MRIVYSGDQHIGKILNYSRGLQKYGYSKFKKLAGFCIQKKVELLVLVGDLFDVTNPPPDAVNFVISLLKKLTSMGVEVLIISGNHDEISKYYGMSPCHILGKIEGITYKNQKEPYTVEYDNINFVCLNFSNPVERFKALVTDEVEKYVVEGKRNVLLSHFPIKEEIIVQPEEYVSYKDLPTRFFDDIILGDIHKLVCKSLPHNCTFWYTGSINHTKVPDWIKKDLTFLYEEEGEISIQNLKKPKTLIVDDKEKIKLIDSDTIVVDMIGEPLKIFKKEPLYYSDGRIDNSLSDIFDELDNDEIDITNNNIEEIIDLNLTDTYSPEAITLLKYVLDLSLDDNKGAIGQIEDKLEELVK